jgi:uncharacterized protein YxjI
MQYRIRQRFFSWFDSFDIYDESGRTAYTVKSKLSWGHCLRFFDPAGNHIATVQEKVITLLPKFEFYIGGKYQGMLRKEISLLRPHYNIDFNGWNVTGDLTELDYRIEKHGGLVATISKEIFHMTDTYVIDVVNEEDALCALMLAVAIDAEKCTASKSS